MFGFVELSWAYAGFRWVVFGPSWDYVASPGLLRAYVYFILDLRWAILARLGPMLAPRLGVCWVLLRSMLRHLGSLLAYREAILGLCWDHVGFCWVVLGLCCPILGLCWTFLGSMLGHLGFVLAYLGAMLRRLGTM